MSVRQSDDTNRTGIKPVPTIKVCDQSAVTFLNEFLLVFFQPLQQNSF